MAKQMRVYDGSQWVEVASSTTDLTAYATKTGIETLTNKTLTSPTITGSGFDAWTSYSPTWTNVTKGTSPVELYHYSQIGKTVTVRIYLKLGSTGTANLTGAPSFSLPVTASTNQVTVGSPVGWAQFSDASPVTENYGFIYLSSSTSGNLILSNAAGTYLSFTSPSAAVPWTWTNNDILRCQFTYEAA